MRTEFTRFLLVGATNTLFSYLLYLLLLLAMSPLLAYTLSYAAGIVLSYFLNVHFVFRKRVSLSSFLKFPLVYLIQYSLGVLVLWLLVNQAGMDSTWAGACVSIVTIPVTFVASRFVIKR
jgi:putative flippase GtrA